MTQKLVQISDLKFPNHPSTVYNYGAEDCLSPLEVANLGRHRLILKLVDELSAMFQRIGMSEVCGRCFKGQLNAVETHMKGYKGNGCCDSCSLLGHSSCLNKPVVCATWMCSSLTARLWPLTYKFTLGIRERLQDAGVLGGAYSSGIVREHNIHPDLTQRRLLRSLIREVRCWTERRREVA